MTEPTTPQLAESEVADAKETIAIRKGLEREVATNAFIDRLLKERAALREQLAQAENERDAALETLHGWTEAQAITNRKRVT